MNLLAGVGGGATFGPDKSISSVYWVNDFPNKILNLDLKNGRLKRSLNIPDSIDDNIISIGQ